MAWILAQAENDLEKISDSNTIYINYSHNRGAAPGQFNTIKSYKRWKSREKKVLRSSQKILRQDGSFQALRPQVTGLESN